MKKLAKNEEIGKSMKSGKKFRSELFEGVSERKLKIGLALFANVYTSGNVRCVFSIKSE